MYCSLEDEIAIEDPASLLVVLLAGRVVVYLGQGISIIINCLRKFLRSSSSLCCFVGHSRLHHNIAYLASFTVHFPWRFQHTACETMWYMWIFSQFHYPWGFQHTAYGTMWSGDFFPYSTIPRVPAQSMWHNVGFVVYFSILLSLGVPSYSMWNNVGFVTPFQFLYSWGWGVRG